MEFKYKTSIRNLTILVVLIYVVIYCYENIAFTLVKWNRNFDDLKLSLESNHNSGNSNKIHVKVSQSFSSSRYKNCNRGDDNMINVHIVMHSHTDPGWIKTLEDYYIDDVQYILDNVITELQYNPEKKFILAEVVFLSIWWKEQSTKTKTLVKQLVREGRLEFVLGGWTMNDEATTHYSAIIDQHTLGFDFLKENFGEYGIPKIAWQSDAFGHSREQASIFAQFGFDGLFFARIDYQDYDNRRRSKTLETMWFGSDSLDDRSALFAGVLSEMSYTSRLGFCYECNDGSYIIDREDLIKYNIDEKSKQFIDGITYQAKQYSTNHLMWIVGGDFQFGNPRINFKNTDKLMEFIRKMDNEDKFNINAFYSTPSCYLYALNKANKTYTSKSDDFFPYADEEERFWTGYYTSRPKLKRSERLLNNVLQICKQLDVFTDKNARENVKEIIKVIKESVALMQHHDAISGTSTRYVTEDYMRIIAEAMSKSHEVLNVMLNSLIVAKKYNGTFLNISFCDLTDISNCPFAESESLFLVVVYNPFGQKVSSFVKFPVEQSIYQIFDSSLKPVVSQQLISDFKHELVFQTDLPAMGFSTYFVKRGGYGRYSEPIKYLYSIENKYLRLEFSLETNLLSQILNLEKNVNIQAKQTIMYYESQRKTQFSFQASGVYVFKPDGFAQLTGSGKPSINFVRGDLVNEVRQTFSNWSSQVIRLYKDARHFEIEWTVGPLPGGKEVISSFDTSIQSNQTFYTDANGRQMMKRVRNHRPSWSYTKHEPISENYYPVNTRIYIQDISKNIQLTILTDRSQGGSSARDGQIELMLHRSTYDDDGLGIEQQLEEVGDDDEMITVRGTHYIFLDTINSSVRLHRTMAQRLYMSPYFGFVKLNQTPQEYAKQFVLEWSGLKSQLPKNVHILTLEEWHNGTVLLRLEHYFEKDEDPELSKPAIVSLKDLFLPLKIVAAEEQTLGANVRLDQAKRLQWNVEGYGKTPKDIDKFVTPFDQKTMKIELKSMQIRTFILTLE